ncbi:hypothetical protein [Streptomyces sp. NPDC048527]|uniref:hypothetical protein n=1 Tax=Streptomyces sp. NPDC048527 TaxID=3365568 RepID=UPI00371F44A9
MTQGAADLDAFGARGRAPERTLRATARIAELERHPVLTTSAGSAPPTPDEVDAAQPA